ncbi:hypothetical protein [Sphingomonas oleivorans]|uniref:hypothetical protein n=1 Tax=Sphingomonas oleivorans TaxID=1735121 RepID=UPI001A9D0494|nr:hypothetical protein [Sphingomonas oleivorans]
MAADTEIAFLFIGGAHQVFHLAPVAAELSRLLPDTLINCFFPDEETGAALLRVKTVMNARAMRLTRIATPRWAAALARIFRHHSLLKGPLLLRLAPHLAHVQAIVTPERTSAALRFIGLRHKLMIHFRHGAGDRAPHSEARLKAFDLIVVPGEKDLARAVEVQHVDPARLGRCGYVKLDFLSKISASPHRYFDNDRPVIIYNPHFDPALSSWPMARAVLALFSRQDRYNLIFAPHIRLSEDMTAEEIESWNALAEKDHILIDLHSPRLLDMSYIAAADIYLGDMSSQLYEFLARPRPAVFLNTHKVSWRGDPRYAGWQLGEVVDDLADLMAAIDRAVANHPALAKEQAAAVRAAFGPYAGAIGCGARLIASATGRRTNPPSDRLKNSGIHSPE